jgi:hypothetical protein
LEDAQRFAATVLESGVLINDGHARFAFQPLPRIAQIAPGFGVALTEIDGDGHADILIAQNFYTPQVETGRMAGGLSQLLTGNGDGTFTPVPPHTSGLVVPEDAKSLTQCDLNADGWPDFVIGVNDGPPKAFVHRGSGENRLLTVALRGLPGNRSAAGARVSLTLADGTKRTAEVCAGGGYLSQSSARLVFGLGRAGQPKSLEVHWPNGEVSRAACSEDARELVVEQQSRH